MIDKGKRAYLASEFADFMAEVMSDFDYSDIDGFIEEQDLSEEEVEFLYSIDLKVEAVSWEEE
jgi:hypothetical protein